MKKIMYITGGMLLMLNFAGCEKPYEEPYPTDEYGVEINGVTWATRDVGEPGKFVEKSHLGMLYQWDRIVPWYYRGTGKYNPYTGYEIEEPVSIPAGESLSDEWWMSGWRTGDVWRPENDPCPEGWRVPTREEFESLVDREKVTYADRDGELFADIFTDKSSKKQLYFISRGLSHWSAASHYSANSAWIALAGMEDFPSPHLYARLEHAERAVLAPIRCVAE